MEFIVVFLTKWRGCYQVAIFSIFITERFLHVISRAGHRKFKLNSATTKSAKLQEVFRNRKSASLR